MMLATRHRQTREIRGPDPNSVALIARMPGRVPPDRLLMERRMKDEQSAAAEELARLAKMQDMRNDWEKSTDRKLQANAVRYRMQRLLRDTEVTLEARRQRLRELLEAEKFQYLAEAEATQETSLDRQSRLRERAKELREKREMDRLAFVEQKLEQQFRDQCEELRTTVSKQQRRELQSDLTYQMRQKKDQLEIQRQDEQFFEQLWLLDIEKKAKREEEEAKKRMEANHQNVAFLQQQMAALEQKKQAEKQLIREEAQLLRQAEELRKLEAHKEAEEKRRAQMEAKSLLDQTLKVKREIQARQAQEELAFDLKMLEQIVEQSKAEQSEMDQRKRELREEDRRYREYLRLMRAEEKKREIEMERLCDAEVEKMWEKRLQQWKAERLARQKLLQEVMESRRHQLQQKLEANLMRREEAKRDREILVQQLNENKQISKDEIEKLRNEMLAYRSDLLGQIDYNQRQRALQLDEDKRLAQRQLEAETEYQRKIEYLRNKPVLEKIHPVRRAMYTSTSSTDPRSRQISSAPVVFG